MGGKREQINNLKKKNIFFPVRLIQVRHKFSEKEAGGGKLKEKEDTKHGQHRVAVPSPRHLSRTAFPVPQERG